MHVKHNEDVFRDTPEDFATAYIIRSIEILGDRHQEIVENCRQILGGQEFMDVAIAGTAKRIMALKDTGKPQ